MSDLNQVNQTSSPTRPATALSSSSKDPPLGQISSHTQHSSSAPHQQSNTNDAQMTTQTNIAASNGNGIATVSNTVQPPVASTITTPPRASNQPTPPAYRSPYSQSAPFPALHGQMKAPTPIHPPSYPHFYTHPRSATATTTLATSDPAAQGRTGSTPGYVAYAQDLRQAASNVRNGRLSPVSHVHNALSIVSDTGYTPTSMQRLAGVMAGNPMINSVKVIQRLADGYEEVCVKLDERDATIRHLHASQAQLQAEKTRMQAEQARKIHLAVEDALRLSRPPPRPTEQQAADLRDRDEKIKALEAFVEDQAKKIVELEEARDHAQDMQLDLKKKYEEELAAAKDRSEKLAEELSAVQNRAQQRRDFIASQESSHGSEYGHHQDDTSGQDQNQISDQNQAFSHPQAIGQLSEFDFEDLFTQPSPGLQQNNGNQQNLNMTQHNQQRFDDPFDFVQQPPMPDFLQELLRSQGKELGQLGGTQAIDDPFGMDGQQGNLFQQDMSPRRGRTIDQSFAPQNMNPHQSPPGFKNMQSQQTGQNQRSSLMPGRQQRMPGQIQQSPRRFQNMPGQGQQNSTSTPKRQRIMAGQQSPSRGRNNQMQGQGQGQRDTPSPNVQQSPQPKGKRARPTKKGQQASAKQNTSGQATQRPTPAKRNKQNNSQATIQANIARRTTQSRAPKKPQAQAPSQQSISNQQNSYHHRTNPQNQNQTYIQSQVETQQYVPPQTRKRNASSLDDQQEGETPQSETNVKITLDELSRSVRRRFGRGEVGLNGGFKRSF